MSKPDTKVKTVAVTKDKMELFEESLKPKEFYGIVDKFFDANPEILKVVQKHLKTLQMSSDSSLTPTKIWRGLRLHFGVKFSDHSFRLWVRKHFGDDFIRSPGRTT